MSEIYTPKLQSGPYTIEWAKRRGVTPEALDPRDVISHDPAVKRATRRILGNLITENLDVCGPEGRVSLPSYPVKRVLPDTSAYGRIIYGLHRIFEDIVDKRAEQGIPGPETRLLSIAYGKDGYKPEPGETIDDAKAWVVPQTRAAVHLGYRPIAEATTTLTRFTAAWRAADEAEAKEIDIGLAFDSHGHLAGDGATLKELRERVEKNPDKLSLRPTLGANCGSLTGIEKAARAHPGALAFAYANSVDAEDIDRLGDLENGTVHHHHDQVTPEEFARVVRKYRFPTVSLCCGFCPEDLKTLKALASSGE